MTTVVQFLPIATVEVDDDGTCRLGLDWGDSQHGEWNEATGRHEPTPLSERVSRVLDSWLVSRGEQRVTIGKLP